MLRQGNMDGLPNFTCDSILSALSQPSELVLKALSGNSLASVNRFWRNVVQ
jgi:hypothetical protein